MSGFEISLAIGGVTLVIIIIMVAIFFATRPAPKQFFSQPQPQPQLTHRQKTRIAFDAIEDAKKDLVADIFVGALGAQGAKEEFGFIVRAANAQQPQPQPQPGSPGWNQPPFPNQPQAPIPQSVPNPGSGSGQPTPW